MHNNLHQHFQNQPRVQTANNHNGASGGGGSASGGGRNGGAQTQAGALMNNGLMHGQHQNHPGRTENSFTRKLKENRRAF